jgi:hypothetical protein
MVSMKTKIAILCLCVMLAGAGCATLTPQPIPPGCEASFLYTKTSFLPLGPVLVRLGVVDLAMAVPSTRKAILQVCDRAEGAINQGNLAGAIGYFLGVLEVQPKDILLRIAIMNARVILMTLSLNPGISNATLNECDRNILLSLIQNIRRDLQ